MFAPAVLIIFLLYPDLKPEYDHKWMSEKGTSYAIVDLFTWLVSAAQMPFIPMAYYIVNAVEYPENYMSIFDFDLRYADRS